MYKSSAAALGPSCFSEMPPRTGICGEADVRELFGRTDSYFSRVGLLPVVVPLPIQGDCGALKRGLLRLCLLCSSHIDSLLRRALTAQHRRGEGGPVASSGPQETFPSAPASDVDRTAHITPIGSDVDELRPPDYVPLAPPDEVSSGPLISNMVLREKLKIFARELDDDELERMAGPPLLDEGDLDLPAVRKVVECVDRCSTEGVLLLLCERRSSSLPDGPYKASLDTLMNGTEGQREERQLLLQEERMRQPPISDLGLGVVAGGIVTVASTGLRQLTSLFCIEELPDDARHQLVRVLLVRLLALGFLWPSVFCSSSLSSDDDIRAPAPSLLHFPRAAVDFLCHPSGLQLSRHFDADDDGDGDHADQVRGCACIRRMQRRVQQQAARARRGTLASPADDHSPAGRSSFAKCSPEDSPREQQDEWREFWAVGKRRFYSIWAQRGSQLVPETPANSLIEAFDSPLKFAQDDSCEPLPSSPSPSRRRGGPRTRRSKTGGTSAAM